MSIKKQILLIAQNMENNMSEQKHSSLPWKFNLHHSKPDDMRMEYDVSTEEAGFIMHNAPYENIAPSKEDAAFICRAVNSHYQLVDALEAALTDLRMRAEWDAIDKIPVLNVSNGVLNQMHKALKLAKGE